MATILRTMALVAIVLQSLIGPSAAKAGLEDVIIGMAGDDWSSAFMDLAVGFAATAFTGISALLVYYLTQDRPLDPKEKANQTMEKLKTDLRRDPGLTFRWCQANGLVADTCPLCDKPLDVGDSTKGGQIKCMTCKKPVPALQGTWFEGIDIDPWKAISVMYHWATGNNHRSASRQLALDEDTIKHWYKRCQEASEYNLRLCSNAKTDEEEDAIHFKKPIGRYHYGEKHIACYCPKYKIGGKGRIVEVEILERGDLLQEKYVLAAVERGGWRAFAVPLADRGTKTVKAIVKSKVFPGTVVKAALEEDAPLHSNELRHVRGLLKDISEKMVQPATEDMIPVYLTQWMWRKVHETGRGDVFTTMIENVSKAFPFTNGDMNIRRHAASFVRPDDEDEPEEVCTHVIMLPNKPPVINKIIVEKPEPKEEKALPKPKPIRKRRPLPPRDYVRIAPRPQIVRTPPPGAPLARRVRPVR